jgi:hypothetical protein
MARGGERSEEDEDGGGGQIRGRGFGIGSQKWGETEKRGGKEDGEIGAVFVLR